MLALYRCGRQSDALEHYARRARSSTSSGSSLGGACARCSSGSCDRIRSSRSRRRGPTAAALPVPPTTLVGRERELTQLVELLERHDVRLVVLTGAGGSGKTRLALEAAAGRPVLRERRRARRARAAPRSRARRPDDPREPRRGPRVGRGPVRDPRSRRSRRGSSCSSWTTPSTCGRRRRSTPSCVARAPRLTILVTSRAVLHVSGEHVFPVAPLDEDEAVELFVERARLLEPSFARTHGERARPRRDLPARRRAPARDRARRRAGPHALARRAARAARRAPRTPHRRPARPPGAAADAAGDASTGATTSSPSTSARCSHGSPSSRPARRSRPSDASASTTTTTRARPRRAPPRRVAARRARRPASSGGTACSRPSASTPRPSAGARRRARPRGATPSGASRSPRPPSRS